MVGKHPPVVIVERNGFPVRPVEGHAPSLSVVESNGAAITITDNGAPFILEGYSPEPPIDFDWQSFSLTAGEEGQWLGYSTGGATLPQPAFGSIDRQPTSLTTLLALYDDTASNVFLAVFEGDFAQALQGIGLSIGGFIMYAFEIEVIAGNTWLRFNGPGDLTPGADYEMLFGFFTPSMQALASDDGALLVTDDGKLVETY